MHSVSLSTCGGISDPIVGVFVDCVGDSSVFPLTGSIIQIRNVSVLKQPSIDLNRCTIIKVQHILH